MARKKKIIREALAIKKITRYVADTQVYSLSQPLKVGVDLTDFLLIQDGKGVSGGNRVTVWPCDVNGTQLSTLPILDERGRNVVEALKSLGYDLVK